MASTSGAAAAKAQPGHQAPSSSSSAFRTKDSERSSKEELNQARLDLNAHPDNSFHDIHDSLDPITSHIKSYSSGSRPIYDPLQRILEESPNEQPWSTPVHFAKGAERDCRGK